MSCPGVQSSPSFAMLGPRVMPASQSLEGHCAMLERERGDCARVGGDVHLEVRMEWAAAVVALGISADAYFVWQVSLHILSDATLVASAVMKTV